MLQLLQPGGCRGTRYFVQPAPAARLQPGAEHALGIQFQLLDPFAQSRGSRVVPGRRAPGHAQRAQRGDEGLFVLIGERL